MADTIKAEASVKISFGDVVAAAIDEIGCTTDELSWEERKDPDTAGQHYKRNVADRLRRLFDQIEAQSEREKEQEAARIRRREEREQAQILQVLKDIIEHEPDVRAAVAQCMGVELMHTGEPVWWEPAPGTRPTFARGKAAIAAVIKSVNESTGNAIIEFMEGGTRQMHRRFVPIVSLRHRELRT